MIVSRPWLRTLSLSAVLAASLLLKAGAQAPSPFDAPTELPSDPSGQTPNKPAPDPMPGGPPPAGPSGRQRLPGAQGPAPQAKPAGSLKAYTDVITDKAKTEAGLFTVHRIDDRIYFEIPPAMLNRVMLITTEIAELPAGRGYGGTAVNDNLVRWTRRNNKVYLRMVDTSVRADEQGAIQNAIHAATVEPIILSFDVETEGKDKAPVIDVTRLFTSDVTEFSVRSRLGGGNLDPSRSYLDVVKAFPTNIETKTVYTFFPGGNTITLGGRGIFFVPGSTITATIHYSMTLLPETPMMGRLADSRVGFFTDGFQDYGRPEHRVVDRAYINRFRLEKKDPRQPLSEPVKPITFYLSREIPEKWRPYMIKAVEAWNDAFEQAGFIHAIQCKEAPTKEQDPDWDPEDARYSVIRWAPTQTENAMGPHVSDPRSGEVISAHIIVWHNVLKLGETWYFTQVGPLDKRAQRLPLPDTLMGEIVQYIVTHEVGHTLGLEHNFKGSSSYTVAQLRNPEFTSKFGDEASIMDYGRFNYVAQPGDNARLIPIIGPYDKFAIAWGYTPIPNTKSPDDEKTQLDAWASRQANDATLRFGGGRFDDPTQQSEDLGSDPVEATRMGLKNIARVIQMLPNATVKYGEDYDLLQEMYGATLDQRTRELGHVVALVGGVVQTDYHAGRGNEVFRPVPKEKQAEAVKFLVENAFTTPKELMPADILFRIQSNGVADQVLNTQRYVLQSLLSESRMKRLVDTQLMMPLQAYTVSQLVNDVQQGLWSELSRPQPTIDLYRRNLQRAYLNVMKPVLATDSASQTELRPVARGALHDLVKSIDKALLTAKDRDTILHLQDSRMLIDRILNPRS